MVRSLHSGLTGSALFPKMPAMTRYADVDGQRLAERAFGDEAGQARWTLAKMRAANAFQVTSIPRAKTGEQVS